MGVWDCGVDLETENTMGNAKLYSEKVISIFIANYPEFKNLRY